MRSSSEWGQIKEKRETKAEALQGRDLGEKELVRNWRETSEVAEKTKLMSLNVLRGN